MKEILVKISGDVNKMAETVEVMVSLVYQGLIENEAHYLDSALNKERILDDFEKEVTGAMVNLSQELDKEEYSRALFLGQAAQNLERMGDELRNLIERIEIKIAEKLLFSQIGVEQYQDVFKRMQESVNLARNFLKDNPAEILEKILQNGEQIKKLVEQYRKQHLERLAEGICQPRAANLFFDMLDFTGNIARHCTNIARIYKESK